MKPANQNTNTNASRVTQVVTLHPMIVRMLTASYDYDRVIRAVNGEYNQPRNQAIGEEKRGAMKGGNTYPNGELQVKDLTNKSQIPIVRVWQAGNIPAELVKLSDAFGHYVKGCGLPSGDLTPDFLPVHIRQWLDAKFANGKAPKVKAPRPVKAPSLPTPPARSTTPQNGNGQHAAAVV